MHYESYDSALCMFHALVQENFYTNYKYRQIAIYLSTLYKIKILTKKDDLQLMHALYKLRAMGIQIAWVFA